MSFHTSSKNIIVILRRYKLLATILFVLLFLLLIRIPLGTFNEASWIDAVAHVILPPVGASLLYAWFVQCSYLPRLQPKAILLFIVLIGLALEIGWEIIEFTADQTLGTNWQLGNTDTMIDIISGVVGSFIGGLLFINSNKKQTSSR